MSLTGRQQVFLEHYLATWNATDSARRAGYASPNKAGPRLLVNDGIAAEIRSRLEALTMTANEVLVRLTEQARGDIGDVITVREDGSWQLDLAKATAAGKTRLIKKLKEAENGVEFELYSSQEALVNLGKAHGLFREKVEHSGEATLRVIYDDKPGDSPAPTA
jgi:phage terminase small subunit